MLKIFGFTFGGSGGGSAIIAKDEGVTLTAALSSIDFTGVGVTASAVGNAVTVDIPGGGSTASFTTIQTDAGTSPVATGSSDPLTLTSPDLTVSGNSATDTVTLSIKNDAVTYAKMQNVSAASKLLGRGDSGSGDPQEITLGTGLAMTGTTLSASGGGTGDVVGPSSSTDNAITRFDGTTGKLVQNSGGTIDDSGNAAFSGTVSSAGTLLKTDNVSATSRVLGRSTAGAGAIEELTLGSRLSLSSGVLDAVESSVFGTGFDGDVTLSGSVTLARDMHYNNLTIGATASCVTQGWRVFVKGTADFTAAPASALRAPGSNGSSAAGTAAGSAPLTQNGANLGSNGISTVGVAGGTAAGAQAGAVTALSVGLGGAAGASGAGGLGSGGAGGASRAGGVITTAATHRSIDKNVLRGATLIGGGAGGAGGGSGGGDATAGGGSGTGGQGGCVMYLAFNTISRGGSTAAGSVHAKGGNGGAGGVPAAGDRGGGGGGSGGGGGAIILVYQKLTGSTATGMLDASGGNGGNGGNGTGTGVGGNGGSSGVAGRITVIDLSANSISDTSTGATVTGGTASGTTGGTGATATTFQVDV